MEEFAFKVSSLSKHYVISENRITVLDNVDLTILSGRWATITGKSGCGKTTLLRLLGALDDPDSGTIECMGEVITKMGTLKKARLRRRKLGFIFQSYQLLPELNALENVMLPGRLHMNDLNRIKTKAEELLNLLGIQDRLNHHPAELSGGEQQRIAIARALMNEPEVILADEPTGNLDDRNGEEIMNILTKLRDDKKKTIIMVTHNTKLTQYADISFEIADGKVSVK